MLSILSLGRDKYMEFSKDLGSSSARLKKETQRSTKK
jgi:hypothetical protein